MDAKVVWKGLLSFAGTADSGFSLPLSGSMDAGGAGDGFEPMELFAIGLAGCTSMDVISILTKKRQVVTAFEVLVHADRAEEHPKVMTRANIEYLVTGRQVDEKAVVRSIELSALKYCPAQAMLARVMPIDLHYSIYEEDGVGGRTLVTTGTYVPTSEGQSA